MNCPNCAYDVSLPVSRKENVRSYHCPHCKLLFDTVEQLRSVAGRQAFQAAMYGILKENAWK